MSKTAQEKIDEYEVFSYFMKNDRGKDIRCHRSETEYKIVELCNIAIDIADHKLVVQPLNILSRKHNKLNLLDEIPSLLYKIGNLRDEMLSLLQSMEIDDKVWYSGQHDKIKNLSSENVTETSIKMRITRNSEWIVQQKNMIKTRLLYNKLNNAYVALTKKFESIRTREVSERKESEYIS